MIRHTLSRIRVQHEQQNRRGSLLILSLFCLMACMGLVAFSVDLGYVNVTKVKMQNAVDAAALAAAQEITAAIESAGPDVEDVVAWSLSQARLKARDVAALNDVYVDPDRDVEFGRRSLDSETGEPVIEWGVQPANTVRVTAHRDNPDSSEPDGKLPLFFAGFNGRSHTDVVADAVAYVESRDIVVVHDFSRSMNYDSYFNNASQGRLTQQQIEDNLEMIYEDLQPVDFGDLVFEPKYLTLEKQDGSSVVSATFKYDEVDVQSTDELVRVKLRYATNNNTQEFSASGTSGTFTGSGSRSGDDIEKVWVTVRSEGGSPETMTGEPPSKGCEPQVEVTFSADRTSVDVTSSKDLSNVVLKFSNGVEFKFDNLSLGQSATFTGVGAYVGLEIETVWVKSGCNKSGDGPGYGERFDTPPKTGGTEKTFEFEDTDANVKIAFGLDTTPYPYPVGSWDKFIDYVRDESALRDAGYREMYGGMTLLCYILDEEAGHWETPDLWKTRHYPFHAIKEGHELFCNFVNDLGFGDHLGMVSYDTNHRVETTLDEDDPEIPYVDISSSPITSDYTSINNLMKYRQAAHYSYSTNMGGGLKDATALLEDYCRPGARGTIVLMTDGNTNTIDHGESTALPHDWDWDELLDYDGDGNADYYTSSSHKRYVLRLAKEAVDLDYTIHTMSVGADADRDLMRAIAWIGRGEWVDVPGGSTIEEMEEELLEAFNRIAAFVPPAKLMHEDE